MDEIVEGGNRVIPASQSIMSHADLNQRREAKPAHLTHHLLFHSQKNIVTGSTIHRHLVVERQEIIASPHIQRVGYNGSTTASTTLTPADSSLHQYYVPLNTEDSSLGNTIVGVTNTEGNKICMPDSDHVAKQNNLRLVWFSSCSDSCVQYDSALWRLPCH